MTCLRRLLTSSRAASVPPSSQPGTIVYEARVFLSFYLSQRPALTFKLVARFPCVFSSFAERVHRRAHLVAASAARAAHRAFWFASCCACSAALASASSRSASAFASAASRCAVAAASRAAFAAAAASATRTPVLRLW